MILSDGEIMVINQTAEFDSAIGYARAIEAEVLEKLSDKLRDGEKQRDELLAALERIEGASMSMYTTRSDMTANMQEIAYAAIASVKGQA